MMLRRFVVVALFSMAGGFGCGTTPEPAPEYAPMPAPAPSPAAQAPAEETAHAPSWKLASMAESAAPIADLGAHKRKVSTTSTEAQAFFDQGLALIYGFNHDEAARSFARAAALDPACAMCFWGAAYALGPNYNMPMLPERAEAAWDAIQKAQKASPAATPVEQALVAALAKRFKGPQYVDPEAMMAFNQAYADAMRPVAAEFKDDLDVQVLYAEALMNLNAWKLWTPEGEPAPGTQEIVETLEAVLKKNPNHPGANHYYIHTVEASKTPERAEASADRLGALIPAAGHIVHMPAHIYQRIGRYSDASKANKAATKVDEALIAKVPPLGYYPIYLGHNYGFLAYSASMEGRGAEALDASRQVGDTIPKDFVCGMPGADFFLSTPIFVMVRFGRFEELLAEPKPEAKYPVLSALWHHGQGMALAATGKAEEARAHAQAIGEIAATVPEEVLAGLNSGRLVLELAQKVLEARIAQESKAENAIELWSQAVAIEDQLAYNEPADWFYPVRHYLGAALLDAGKAKDAEAVYRADLERNPKNGWALFGLWKSLEAQKRAKDAKATQKTFKAAWANADIELTRSAF